MTAFRDVVEPGPDRSPAATTASLDEVAAIIYQEVAQAPMEHMGPRQPRSSVVTGEESSNQAFQQDTPPVHPEEPPLPLAQSHPRPLTPEATQIDELPPPPPKCTTVHIDESSPPKNIVFFGETGVGKSAIINMLREKSEEQFDDATAAVSSAALGCTLNSRKYPCRLRGQVFVLWDTAGLVEGEFGNVTSGKAEDNLVELLRNMDGGGVSLLVYCIRARRFRTVIKQHYELFYEKACQKRVPVLLVVNGLENEDDMEDWWRRNEGQFVSRGIRFQGHACITSTRGKVIEGGGHVFDEEYEESFQHLRGAIFNLSAQTDAQTAGPKESYWPTLGEVATRSSAGLISAKHHMARGARKGLAGMASNLGHLTYWRPGDTSIKDDTTHPVYNTAGPLPPKHFPAEPALPDPTHLPPRPTSPDISHTTHQHSPSHPQLAYKIATAPGPLHLTKLSRGIGPSTWPPNAQTQTQSVNVYSVSAPCQPQGARGTPCPPAHAPGLTQIQDDTSQPLYRIAAPDLPQKEPRVRGAYYLDNGTGVTPFHP